MQLWDYFEKCKFQVTPAAFLFWVNFWKYRETSGHTACLLLIRMSFNNLREKKFIKKIRQKNCVNFCSFDALLSTTSFKFEENQFPLLNSLPFYQIHFPTHIFPILSVSLYNSIIHSVYILCLLYSICLLYFSLTFQLSFYFTISIILSVNYTLCLLYYLSIILSLY